MTKAPDGSSRARSTTVVRDRRGGTHPFLRGMVTHDLVQRGVPFDDAYAVARSLKDRLADRGEIESSELDEMVDAEVARVLGAELAAGLPSTAAPSEEPLIVDRHGEERPFSRGLLARSLQAAGVHGDRSYRLAIEVQSELQGEGVQRVDHSELGRRVGDVLDEREGHGTAARYRIGRRLDALPRPLVIYVSGASGTGKSSLALELAPLMRIYQVNATDSIRQVMRMVFSAAILPGIHRSSFDAGALGLSSGNERQQAISHFEEQATRVCVGVRAVVERALAENISILVEGTHLLPGLVPFSDLDGGAYQLMLVLSTLDEDIHRSRFVHRGRVSNRSTEHYLANFSAIRVVQDHLLDRAETAEIPILDTSNEGSVLHRAMRQLTGEIEQKIPWIAGSEEITPAWPVLYLVIDGMADQPVRALGGRTPLQAASTPVLDRLAREGVCGIADPIAPGVVPDTAAGSLALLGQSPMALARGPVEALGAGIRLQPGDIALRANFATLDEEGRVIDRRAGRIREGAPDLVAALQEIRLPADPEGEVEVLVGSSTEHRVALILRGDGLSPSVTGSDPGDAALLGPPLVPTPIDPEDVAAIRTARLLALVEKQARRILQAHAINRDRAERGLHEANVLLTRGAGRIHPLEAPAPRGRPLEFASISGDRTMPGLVGWMGGDTIREPGMTANLDSDVDRKFRRARKILSQYDFVVVHVKGADIAAHDRRPESKVEFLERVDAALGETLKRHPQPLRVVVAADHATLSESGQHSADPVPVLIWGEGVEADSVEVFDEVAAAAGRLERGPLQLLLGRAFESSP